MSSQHTTLNAALTTIEDLISQGFSSFKLYRSEGKVWNVIVNPVQAHKYYEIGTVCLTD
jgi:hypothetical protein